MIDLLLTIMIILFLIPVVMICLHILFGTLHFDQDIQDLIASYQLRRILLISYDKSIEDNVLYFNYQSKQMKLREVNNNLIIQPGTQIMYVNIENASFYESGNVIYLYYERNGNSYEEAIANLE